MSERFACLDAAYNGDRAFAAAALFETWDANSELELTVAETSPNADYVSGQLYRRELPVLLAALDQLSETPATLIVDGYVWLNGAGTQPGLGAHLRRALSDAPRVVGVAKSPLQGDDWSARVCRGGSVRPLYVTSAGLAQDAAAHGIAAMAGAHRIPDLLRRVDRAARVAAGT
ncbi:MAG: endonuclease V [Pseudomonadota bacterium]